MQKKERLLSSLESTKLFNNIVGEKRKGKLNMRLTVGCCTNSGPFDVLRKKMMNKWVCRTIFCRSDRSIRVYYVYIVSVNMLNVLLNPPLTTADLSEESETTIYRCWYSKDVHRTKCQALTVARLTHSPYTTKLARIRGHMMLSTILKCKSVTPHCMYNRQNISGLNWCKCTSNIMTIKEFFVILGRSFSNSLAFLKVA